MPTKICKICGVEKNISAFDKGRGMKYGVRNICRECRRYLWNNGLSESTPNEYAIKDGHKKCIKCGIVKPISEFWKTISNKDGVTARCAECMRQQRRDYVKTHGNTVKKIDKKSSTKNKDRKNKTKREWMLRTGYLKSEKRKKYQKEYSKKDTFKEWHNRWAREYAKRDYVKEKTKEYRNNKLKTDANFAISCVERKRLYNALKIQDVEKQFKYSDLIGCTPSFLRLYLESLWTEGMSWENRSHKGWHIDHIIPCASFNLADEAQLRQCFHYKNLQPLWAKVNLSKGKKLIAA